MSRVHDALRRAEQAQAISGEAPTQQLGPADGNITIKAAGSGVNSAILADVEEVPYKPAPESHLLDLEKSHETPAEEFRTLRTRLNHLQTL